MLDGSPYPSTHIQLSKTAHSAPNLSGASCCNLWFEVLAALRRIPPGTYLVEIAGIEPATSGLQSRRSPN
jgi:hypothetical protein